MEKVYRLGQPVEIAIRNRSNEAYYYQVAYPACYNLKFFDDTTERRPYPYPTPRQDHLLLPGQFIVPEGTHCDIISERPIAPGERGTILVWKQLMCTEDIWGCIQSVPVEPGQYRIEGLFSTAPGMVGPPVRSRTEGTTDGKTVIAEWTFVISDQLD